MQRTILRWGLGMGGVGAAIGVVSLLLGIVLGAGRQSAVDSTQIAVVIFVFAMVRLFFLGVVVGLAYYVGFRIERTREAPPTGQMEQGSDHARPNRMDAVLAGGLMLFCDWVVQTLFMYATGMWGKPGPFLPFLGSQLVFGVICVLFGAGVAGLGARDAASRRVLSRLRSAPTLPSDASLSVSSAAISTPVENSAAPSE